MVFALLACSVALHQGSPTTPIGQPKKPQVKTAVKKSPEVKAKPAEKVEPPKPPPAFKDEPAGLGEPVKPGDVVTIDYLVKRPDGSLISDSRRLGLSFTFKLGEKGNDPLFDLVVKGMKPGATRRTELAAKDVYGSEGAPPAISAKDSLVVIVTLLRRGS